MALTPIEKKMGDALLKMCESLPSSPILLPQYELLSYRVDFALIIPFPIDSGDVCLLKYVIECDGHDFHEKTKWQAAKDKKRERDLQAIGWRIVRFSGSEIHKDSEGCANQLQEILKSHVSEGLHG